MEWIVWKPFSDRVRIPTWVDSVEKSSPPPKNGLWWLLITWFYFAPINSSWRQSLMDVTGYHQISPGDTMLQLRNAMGRCCTRHHFCVCGQVVKLFPVSISFLTLVVAAFAKFKKFRTVFLKDVWFSTMFQHLKNWSSQKLGTYP